MINGIQNLVNAQVSVNRAVHEANQESIRLDYLIECIDDAIIDLKYAARKIKVAKKGLSADSKYVIQRTHNVIGAIFYLSPGERKWITEIAHEKFGTRYGKWFWAEAEKMSQQLNLVENSGYTYVPLPERNHK